MYYGKWYVYFVCKKCKEELNHNERMYSNGVCPHCGECNNSTIVDYIRNSRRFVYESKLNYILSNFLFFKAKGFFEYKDN
jgi:predicted RNA-binding Zn-ribbon protein involved in translation (DUF1610 family)